MYCSAGTPVFVVGTQYKPKSTTTDIVTLNDTKAVIQNYNEFLYYNVIL